MPGLRAALFDANTSQVNNRVVTLPAGAATGDLVVIAAGIRNTAATSLSATAGWTVLSTGEQTGDGGGAAYGAWWRVLEVGDTAPTVTASDTGRWAWGAIAIMSTSGGALSLDGAHAVTVDTTGATTSQPPAKTATVANVTSVLIQQMSASASGATAIDTTPPTNWTEPANGDATTASGTNVAGRQISASCAYRTGQSGTITPGTLSTNVSTIGVMWHVLVQETATGSTATLNVTFPELTGDLAAQASASATLAGTLPELQADLTALAATNLTQLQLIPLYVYPSWWVADNDWFRAASLSSPGSVIIANPLNGPDVARNTDYAQGIEIAHDYGQKVIGYVDTNYSTVPLATAKADIDDWYAFYNGNNTGVLDTGPAGIDSQLDGIFLDQVGNFPADPVLGPDGITVAAYYADLYAYIKANAPAGRDLVVGNPGATAPTDWQINPATEVADIVTVFEGETETLASYTPEAWVATAPAAKISMMVYDCTQAQIADQFLFLKNYNAGWVSFSDATVVPDVSTPWNSFPPTVYWEEVVTRSSATGIILAMILPELTGSFTAEASTEATLAGTFPELTADITAQAAASATLAGMLPELTASLTAQATTTATLTGVLPELTAELTAQATAEAVVAGVLPELIAAITAEAAGGGLHLAAVFPELVGSFTADASTEATFAGTFPELTATITAEAVAEATLAGTLPELVATLTAAATAEITLAGMFPELVAEITLAPPFVSVAGITIVDADGPGTYSPYELTGVGTARAATGVGTARRATGPGTATPTATVGVKPKPAITGPGFDREELVGVGTARHITGVGV